MEIKRKKEKTKKRKKRKKRRGEARGVRCPVPVGSDLVSGLDDVHIMDVRTEGVPLPRSEAQSHVPRQSGYSD